MLKDYIHAYLGNLAVQLGWDLNSYDLIVSETLSAYGVETESEATNTKKLYALTKVEVWKAVLKEVSFDYDFSSDGSSFKRSQLHDFAQQNLALALSDALPYLVNYQIETGEFTTEHDPYSRDYKSNYEKYYS